ncbi:MAG: hypothetical protein J6T96_10295 [Bacteroidales bacterium]|nr:hypothetical protein [Bacteroidales bacterium]
MKEYITKNLVSLLTEKYGYTIETAFDVLYNSETFQKLSDTKTGLYFQSPKYVFTYLDNEIETGKMC